MSAVPLLDLADLQGGETRAMRALDGACRDHGFFLLAGHGMHDLIDGAWRQTRRFFATPAALRQSVARSHDNALGYFDRELTKRRRDRKEVFDFADETQDIAAVGFGRSRWPDELPGLREELLAYTRGCASLTRQLLGLLYTSLGLSPGSVPATIGERHTAFVRLNHYPVHDPLPDAERTEAVALGDMALQHHTDPGVITLLLQDQVGGLQTWSPAAGWIDVPPHPDTIVVNMSDMLQVLSNDRYRASLHRVLPVPGRDRYSIVYFAMPHSDARVAPALHDGTPRYRAFEWREFMGGRLGDNYADYGTDDIQIANFRND